MLEVNSIKDLDNFLRAQLDEKKNKGHLRTLVDCKGKIDFSSNDYLGFAANLYSQYPIAANSFAGGTGSRSISGNSAEAEFAEKKIAAFHNMEAALIFNSGYMANVGLFSCLATKADTYISDELIHASIIDGMRLSYANRVKFKHNNLTDLEKKLKNIEGRKIVAVESVYSMDGDEAPLVEIAALCKYYNASLIVDEAHATGLYGDKGEGLVGKYNLQQDVFACVYTFGKALGLHGAVVTGSNTLRDYLINHARSFIFTTALPPHSYSLIQHAYEELPKADRKKIFSLIAYFKTQSAKMPEIRFMESNSAIQGVVIGNGFKTKALSEYLFDNGIFVKAILPPTVAAGTERLRICLHTFNSTDEIDLLLKEIKTFLS